MPRSATSCQFTEQGSHCYYNHYPLNNHILEQVNENPYLGLNISDNLKWSSQVNKVCNKANSMLGFIRRNLKHCNKKFKETAYISLVRSFWTTQQQYGIPI